MSSLTANLTAWEGEGAAGVFISPRKKEKKKSTHLISGGRESDFSRVNFMLREVGAGSWEEAASAPSSP